MKAQGHIASSWLSQDSNHSLLDPKAIVTRLAKLAQNQINGVRKKGPQSLLRQNDFLCEAKGFSVWEGQG